MARCRPSFRRKLQLIAFILILSYLAFTYNIFTTIKWWTNVNSRKKLHVTLTTRSLHDNRNSVDCANGSHPIGLAGEQPYNSSASGTQNLLQKGNLTINYHIRTLETVESTDYPDLTRFDVPRLSHPNLTRLLNNSQYQQVHKLMDELDTIFTKNNITYILAYGSLLGSYFFHDVLPWDDDLDLLIKVSDKKKMLDLFEEGHGHEHIGAVLNKPHPSKMIKLFYKSSRQAGKYAWRWPFADGMFYDEDKENVWSKQKGIIKMKRSSFYPIHRRPFGGLWLPAPSDPRIFLRQKYHTFVCKSHYWNHRRETRAKPKSVSCSCLKDYYPMVLRTPEGMDVRETLKLGNQMIYSVNIVEPYWNETELSEPYALK